MGGRERERGRITVCKSAPVYCTFTAFSCANACRCGACSWVACMPRTWMAVTFDPVRAQGSLTDTYAQRAGSAAHRPKVASSRRPSASRRASTNRSSRRSAPLSPSSKAASPRRSSLVPLTRSARVSAPSEANFALLLTV